VSTEVISAGAALMGAAVGAAASLVGTLRVERRRAQQERREQLLSLITDALFSGDRTKGVQSKIWMAVVGSRQDLRAWGRAKGTSDVVIGMNRILLGVVNDERESLGLEPLELQDLMALVMASGVRSEAEVAAHEADGEPELA
jgi:hypothetical protein